MGWDSHSFLEMGGGWEGVGNVRRAGECWGPRGSNLKSELALTPLLSSGSWKTLTPATALPGRTLQLSRRFSALPAAAPREDTRGRSREDAGAGQGVLALSWHPGPGAGRGATFARRPCTCRHWLPSGCSEWLGKASRGRATAAGAAGNLQADSRPAPSGPQPWAGGGDLHAETGRGEGESRATGASRQSLRFLLSAARLEAGSREGGGLGARF